MLYLGVLDIKEKLNEQFVASREPPAGLVSAVSPHMIRVMDAVTELQEAGGADAWIVEVKLLEVDYDEVSVFCQDLPPARDVSSPVNCRGVQPRRVDTEAVVFKYFPSSTGRILPGESCREAGQLSPAVGAE